MEYISRWLGDRGRQECIFCAAAVSSRDEDNLVVARSEHGIVMLNAFPYNTAHVMVAPKRHVPRIEMLEEYEVVDLFRLVKTIIRAIDEEYRPEGYNIGLNIGRVAGAGIESHLHIHIVPRWSGDTNFMPIIAETKVIPEDLRTTLKRLKGRLTPSTQ
jgi:ATP adenylyltransferase